MGLFKRLFSLGSKKSKKQRPAIVHNTPIPEQPWSEVRAVDDEEHEAAISRLLRSSSARFVETAELNYATLPPLPHPINKVIHTPASSTISLASTSLNQRGTYNVTVHKRKRHASTEFPYANRDLNYSEENPAKQQRNSLLPTEDSRVLRLRSDPSVASLIDLYDEHGKLSANVFSNSPPSPPREGRAQVRRNGSTLRQLLGAPSSLNSRNANNSGSVEGDISWAERFLAETETASSSSSLDLWTPKTPQSYEALKPDISFAEGDISTSTFDNPAISSMEVELSAITNLSDIDMDDPRKVNSPYQNNDPSTPQRASQVFGFLTRSKQSKAPEPEGLDRSLPELPSCFSSPSDENGTHAASEGPVFNAAPMIFSVTPEPMTDATPKHSRSQSKNDYLPNEGEEFPRLRSAFSDDSHHSLTTRPAHYFTGDSKTIATPGADEQETKQNEIKVIMNGPTRVIVTAPTPSTNREGAVGFPPRGPRAPPRKSSSGSVKRRRSALVELSNSSSNPYPISDPFTAIPPKRRSRAHRRSPSQTSVASSTHGEPPKNLKADVTPPSGGQRKENQLGLSVRNELPSTPLRSNTTGSRSLLRSVVEHAMFRPAVGMTPSPASSSEMSPVGRQIMMDVRHQRMKAREADRERTGKVSSERRGPRI
ncbi:hypothetical protein M413DRAFT_66915 [Hebeloma cylindrosporum]|uniref:Uncharacterized protein n=1 Tax=Hebeloma cylindrosporum TaxID=76867 RepID=A0A0C3CLM3_HEBCY|nr:hypothetical protein M413DRAFT_66915 [Hebeloma cylindrosporum h7]